jgi:hypothetical protein
MLKKKGHLLSKILVSTNNFLGIKPHIVQFFETSNFHKKMANIINVYSVIAICAGMQYNY